MVLDRKVREQTCSDVSNSSARRAWRRHIARETVAITYEEMGLLVTDKDAHWFDPGKF